MKPLPVLPPTDLFARRDVLKLLGVGAAAAMFPACRPSSAPTYRFFTTAEVENMNALANAIIPPDSSPGGAALGAVIYIDHLLSAFDFSPPRIFAGGPYSNRNPYPNTDGSASSKYPPDSFATFQPLDRYAEAHWKLYLYGSEAVGGGPNDAVLGPVVGLRDQVRNGLATVVAAAKVPLSKQTPVQLAETLAAMDPTFQTTLVDLVAQGALSAPEYDGNIDRGGWTLCNYEGDVQPFGFTEFDYTTGQYVERADAPTSTANTGPDPYPLTSDTETLIGLAIVALGGQVFE